MPRPLPLCLLAGVVCASSVLLANAQTAPRELPALEDSVARAFVQARSAAHLRPLARIPNRPALRKILCGSAAIGEARTDQLVQESEADAAIVRLPPTYQAGEPLPADLRRVAEYDDRHSARGRRITRFSVAAFAPPPGAPNGAEPWIGVALYWSRSTEYIAIHFTRSFYPQNLTGCDTPACEAIR